MQYLTFSLDGSMIPWDEASLDEFREFEATKGDVDKVVARLKEMTLVIAVGLRGDYLLVSIGSSTDVLARLGQGKHLAERPELAPLAKVRRQAADLRRLPEQGHERADRQQ